jgi:hypothetical protein
MWDQHAMQPPPPWLPPAQGDDGADDDLVVEGGSGDAGDFDGPEGGADFGADAEWEVRQ